MNKELTQLCIIEITEEGLHITRLMKRNTIRKNYILGNINILLG